MLRRGEVLGGRYEIEREVGQGGAAYVYRAHDREQDRPVALKILRRRGALANLTRFEQEARALAALKHPHVLAVYQAGTYGEAPFLVTEFAARGNLFHNVPKHGLPAADVRRLSRQILAALDYSHFEGVVHRDLKPENVVITGDGDVRLADFGLARARDSVSLTGEGMIVGTPEYLAPEVLGGERGTEAADIFSWACVTYFMARGVPPHRGSPVDVYRARLAGEYDLNAFQGPWREALEGAFESDPLARPTASDLRRALGDGGDSGLRSAKTVRVDLDSQDLDIRRVTGSTRPHRRVRPRARPARGQAARWAGLALVSAGVIGGALVGGDWFARRGGTGPVRAPPAASGADRLHAWVSRLFVDGMGARMAEFYARLEPGELSRRQTAQIGDGTEQVYQILSDVALRYEAELALLRGRAPGSEALRGWFEARAEGLPMRLSLRAGAGEIRALLTDPAISFSSRRTLYESLARFEEVDVLYAAAGLPAPYGIREMTAGFLPVTVGPPWRRPAYRPPPATTPGVGVDLAPGRYPLFRWADPARYASGILLASGPGERVGDVDQIRLTEWGLPIQSPAWDRTPHLRATGDIYLADPARYRAARLRLLLRSARVPSVIRVSWNHLDIRVGVVPGPLVERPADDLDGGWRPVEIALPPAALEEAANGLRVTVHPLTGFPPIGGIRLCEVDLALDG